MPYVTQRQSPAWKHMDPIFCNGSLWPNSSGVVGSLAAWYDSSNTASMLDGSGNPITAGGKVATWKDISGNSPAGERDLLQGTDASRPIYLPWSGTDYDHAGYTVTRTGLYFDGSNDGLKSLTFPLGQPTTVYLVLVKVTSTNNDAMLDGYTLNGLRFANGSVGTIDYITSNAVNFLNNTSMPDVSNVFVASLVFNSTTSSVRQNRGTPATGNSGAVAADGLTLGRLSNTGAPANIFVSELAVYSAAHSLATQSRLVLGFSRKWRFTV